MTDYKQLCAELLTSYEILLGDLRFDNRLAKRARAALAKPELEEPTDKELDLLADCYMITDGETGAVSLEHLDYARAVLARWGNHLGSPDSSLQPVLDPVAWMYQGEPSFDGTDWQDTWEVTTDKRLAEFKATPDQPIPLFFIQPQRQ